MQSSKAAVGKGGKKILQREGEMGSKQRIQSAV
jgi:hypothetical protein